jgi:hypothetical protein
MLPRWPYQCEPGPGPHTLQEGAAKGLQWYAKAIKSQCQCKNSNSLKSDPTLLPRAKVSERSWARNLNSRLNSWIVRVQTQHFNGVPQCKVEWICVAESFAKPLEHLWSVPKHDARLAVHSKPWPNEAQHSTHTLQVLLFGVGCQPWLIHNSLHKLFAASLCCSWWRQHRQHSNFAEVLDSWSSQHCSFTSDWTILDFCGRASSTCTAGGSRKRRF